ncbi:hypothetical protein PFDG_04842 [Plasmodium falciparum Dd2]|uniref:Uncharacterized protein n=1 Tax=Plasmodium falciparum (isolate Dd2) TaxID=57267 RepID=A0A0L7M8W7_PLAF4|nr:hypothetical protein PFDG_04842 [Plasmodium falciparum Dd2]
MQNIPLGFCVGLDDCITKELYAGHISNLLFNHGYNENEIIKFQGLSTLTINGIECIILYVIYPTTISIPPNLSGRTLHMVLICASCTYRL